LECDHPGREPHKINGSEFPHQGSEEEGKPSSVDRAFVKEEFDQVIDILESFPDTRRQYMYPAMFKFQFHLIARLDNTCHVRKDTVKACNEFDFVLTTQLCWLKNVHEE
jgi:hypothetical protein